MATKAETAAATAECENKPRWYHLTPERFIWFVLGVEACLWLSERYHWFSWLSERYRCFTFTERKGLAVVIGIGVLGVSLLGFFLWFLAAWYYHRRFQFGIRTILVLMLAVAIPFSWLAVAIRQAKQQEELVNRLRPLEEQDGCRAFYREFVHPPDWLSNVLGRNFFVEIYWICGPGCNLSDDDFKQCCAIVDLEVCSVGQNMITDDGLKDIGKLYRLKTLDLRDLPITDAGLKYLEPLSRLETLDLTGTSVTEAGVQSLQEKLPQCKISF